MSLLLDAGALIGYERGNLVVLGALAHAQASRIPVLTTAAVTAQVWRDRRRQVRLTMLLRGVDERPLDPAASPLVGELLRRSATSDVPDAALVALAVDGDEILTSDPDDIAALAAAQGLRVLITTV
jgi:hypothetical protein